MEKTGRIKRLDPIVAQRIAAGEVIERPSSVVRELIDNAVDAGATTITVAIENGGLDLISIMDNGSGIAPDDLPLCCESHATSKVASVDDLYHLSTMGFRGEALYSIAACSRVTIASSWHGQSPWSMTVDNGRKEEPVPGGPSTGTKVDVEGLFKFIPARRNFMKRASAEAASCRAVMVEKSLAFPSIEFRLLVDDSLRVHFPVTNRKERVLDALATDKNLVRSETMELTDHAGRFDLYAVCSTPSTFRSDRSHIKVYVNNRPIEDYALVQAVTYGYGEMLPGGSFPYCYLFISVDPELADFNIHPAKREVKLRNKAEIHHQIVEMVRTQVRRTIPRLRGMMQEDHAADVQSDVQPELGASPRHQGERTADTHVASKHVTYGYGSASGYSPAPSSVAEALKNSGKPADFCWFEKARDFLQKSGTSSAVTIKADRTAADATTWIPENASEQDFTYIGQAFSLFLIAEKDGDLYIVDQHAAHERILYDEIVSRKDIQKLMVPLSFDVDGDVDEYLQQNSHLYAEYGIELTRPDERQWEIMTMPALGKPVEKQVVDFISHHCGDMTELDKGLYAIIACHSAIRDGDTLDKMAAEEILRKVFAMAEPRCPHGRTFLVRLSQDELRKSVGRT
ncbi:DNA mismatch repair endonuclease MutL [Parasphaerochaeta coccoides]|uniref:DNA mismatch repair protein MutL n=1 Tax=Parasphaerochaeta coccoides (strain ATCC BAA-1237 / DSM 17374 / SPN1) TaxID=760011 RepID=F4GIC6_PARC1|nr:DNA mismatch repair endonuclease MutL [Parasphaerochaeta coccoides]AEC01634.1 DNA mismatch repair protein mutL [Parasphaerochaeta coccoides DSM 17374]